ncbi:IclR family transcriptional regulator [Nitratireductor rhodophyticola]|uniref:IclR family transcriptional regulator n=1 Tax=Nitratireductor rhodophyticola TaxID=2854036 RepID=UPI0011476399|nr:IclR family transcriptional regulator [Nitratireductor rhodophyticola]WPZ13553.1 IclR family transcriptional regulator [Nitratireductor rhodophyticola]
MDKRDDRRFIVALARGLELLSAFTAERPRMTLAEITKVTGLPKSTVVRILFTLEALGYIRTHDATGSYFPGPKLMSLGLSVLTSMDLVTLATPYAEKLAHRTGRVVNIGVLDDLSVLYCARIGAYQLLDLNIRVGSRIPLHCTAMGSALISFSEPAVRNLILDKLAADPSTRAASEQIRANLPLVHERGYALGDRQFSMGVRGIAVPIWERGNTLAAAMNIASPADAVSMNEIVSDFAPLLIEAARSISTSLGADIDDATGLPRNFADDQPR